MKWPRFNLNNWLGVGVVYGTLGIIILFFFVPIPKGNEQLLNFTMGTFLGATLVTVMRNRFPTKQGDEPNKDKPTQQ